MPAVPGVKLHTSNRLEMLADRLAAVLREPVRACDPFRPETIVVQSRAVARWVSLQLAAKLGICMNCEFPFSRAFIEKILRAFFLEMPADAPFAPEAMSWRIAALLPKLAGRREFADVREYLRDRDALKTFQLAEHVANLFDQYLVYRPDII